MEGGGRMIGPKSEIEILIWIYILRMFLRG